jgi:deoxycytidylate deaminase
MNTKKLVIDVLGMITRDLGFAIGGSTALSVLSGGKAPEDLDLVIDSNTDMCNLLKHLARYSFTKVMSQDPKGFDLHSQYKSDLVDLKIDIFLAGDISKITVVRDCVQYVKPEVVWAARAYYASKGYSKAIGQLVDAGFIPAGSITADTKAHYGNYYGAHQFEPVIAYDLSETDRLALAIVAKVAAKSTETYKVGAMWVSADGKTIGQGFNKSRAYCDHAEVIALGDNTGGTMYCTLSPCTECAKLLASRGVKSVFSFKYTGKL